MQYIIIDLEWNQALRSEDIVRQPVNLVGEIVQIGAVKVDEAFAVEDTFKIMVAPVYYTVMNSMVRKLTHISDADLRMGFPFPKAIEYFRAWCGDDVTFFTWGGDDMPIFRANLELHSIETEWLPTVYDLQPIFDSQITKEKRQCSLTYALEKVGERAYAVHDALNDALNTAAVCRHLDVRAGIENYSSFFRQKVTGPSCRPALDAVSFDGPYKSLAEIRSDPKIAAIRCPNCGADNVCTSWVRQNVDKFVSRFVCTGCSEKGKKEFFVRLRTKRDSSTGLYRVRRAVFYMDEESRSYYRAACKRYADRHKKKENSRRPDADAAAAADSVMTLSKIQLDTVV